jgi:hypothetical protein
MVPKAMATYGTLCGWTLARAHARSGDRIAIAAYLGNGDSFDRAILEFSKAYAEQNERDYQQLAAAVKSGRITADGSLMQDGAIGKPALGARRRAGTLDRASHERCASQAGVWQATWLDPCRHLHPRGQPRLRPAAGCGVGGEPRFGVVVGLLG